MRRRSLRNDRSGVAAVEFAILAPTMIALICGAFELGHMLFARVALEGAVVEAARLATASLESSEAQRDTILRANITRLMRDFPAAPGESITIETRVFRDFSSAYPEPFTDANADGSYQLGEPYTDRNQNGKWDPQTQVTGTLGGPGDVVSLTAVYPKRVLFGFLRNSWALGPQIKLRASTVVRNENVARRL